MNAIKLYVLAMLSILVFIFAMPAQAEIVTIWGEGKHIMGDNDTEEDARKLALLRAKTMCLEKAGTYLEMETVIKNLQLAKDKIKVYTSSKSEEVHKIIRFLKTRMKMPSHSLKLTDK